MTDRTYPTASPKPGIPTLAFLLLGWAGASAQNGFVEPGDNMTLDGIAPIPATVAEDVDRYLQYRTASFAAWHPERLEMLIRTRFADAMQVHRFQTPVCQIPVRRRSSAAMMS